MQRAKLIGIVVLLFFLIVPAQAQEKLDSFTLVDQHDKSHSIQFPHSKNRVIIIGDRDSAPDANLWGQNIGKALGNSVDYVAVAAVGNYPDWLRGVVKGFIKSDQPRLLDWNNIISKKLGYQPQQCLIVIVDKNGVLVGKASGRFSETQLKKLLF